NRLHLHVNDRAVVGLDAFVDLWLYVSQLRGRIPARNRARQTDTNIRRGQVSKAVQDFRQCRNTAHFFLADRPRLAFSVPIASVRVPLVLDAPGHEIATDSL